MKVYRYYIAPLAVFFVHFIGSCQSKTIDKAKPEVETRQFYDWQDFSMGADLSYVNQLEDNGVSYRDSGKVKDVFKLFKDHGANTVRVRLWHTPTWQLPVTNGKLYSDLYDVEKTIRRAKESGMAVNLDFHYSDIWADPANQKVPTAWNNLSAGLIKDSLYQYTLQVLNYLASKNLTPEMVQIGNETNPGILFPYGKIDNGNFKAFADLLKTGIKAVRDFSQTSAIKPKIILHVAQLQDAGWWTKGVIQQEGVTDFDIIGLSHYCKWSQVNTMPGITDVVRQLVNTYGKTVMVVEAAYPFTGTNFDTYNNLFGGTDSVAGYPVNEQGQYKYLKDLVQAIKDGGGKGIMYWEPAWVSSGMRDLWGQGSSWENNALFDNGRNVLKGIDFMSFPYK